MSLLATLYRDGWLRHVDHALAESMRRLRPRSPEPVLAAAALTSRAVASGHSTLPLHGIGDWLKELIPERPLPALPALPEWRDLLAQSDWVTDGGGAVPGCILVLEGNSLSLRRFWDYECRLASALRARCALPNDDFDAAWVMQRLNAWFPDASNNSQAAAVRCALERRFLLLTGAPGTGKTTTVACLLALQVEAALRRGQPAPRLALAAPTGKAAARLAEALRENLTRLLTQQHIAPEVYAAIPQQAQTVHRLLGPSPYSSRFRHHREIPLAADLVLVDEASMVDLSLMTQLVEAVPARARLILVGDPRQLPSVEASNVLAALCVAADHPHSPLAESQIRLTRRWRQTGELGVADLSELLQAGDANAFISALPRTPGLHWYREGLPALAQTLLPAAVMAYRQIAQASSLEEGLRLAKQFRVLTTHREGPSGSIALNALLTAALAPRGNDPARPFHGRLLLIAANSYRHGLYNGDIGLVWRDPDDALHVWFETETGLRAWPATALPAHEDAFALTVHKAQGSEFDRIWLLLPAPGRRGNSREGLYTGLTRARREIHLLASEASLREASARSASRWSGLAGRLQK